MVGIEDRDYKEDKVECKFHPVLYIYYFILQGGQMFMDIIWVV
jgi:hypothetical protein